MLEDSDNTFEVDLKFVRDSYYELITMGKDAVGDMIQVAQATEHPRAYEVLSNMFKHLGDLNNGLLDLHKKKREITKEDKSKILENNTTTNNLFVGSTTELQKMLAKVDKENNERYKNEIIDVTPEEDNDG